MDELIQAGTGQRLAPAGKMFEECVAILEADASTWESPLREGVAFVAPSTD